VSSPVVLVGEVNPYGADPAFALYHLPRRASGDRLRKHLGLHDHTYHALRKVNVCTGKWTRAEASASAWALKAMAEPGTVFVLLGTRVRAPFLGPDFFFAQKYPRHTLATLPHPSGVNRMWDVPGARERARKLMREVAPWVPWGETEET
jgi:hypothetical protein